METIYPWIIAGCIFAIILIVGLFPKPEHPKKKRKIIDIYPDAPLGTTPKIKFPPKATLPEFYQKTYKESSSSTIVNAIDEDDFRELLRTEYEESDNEEWEKTFKPWEPFEFDPDENEKEIKEVKPLKRKLDL